MRFHLIDALRGVAAMWVVLFHAYEGGHIDNLVKIIPDYFTYVIFELGHSGVPIFFVISGFVIAHSITRDKVDGSYLAKFTIRRSIRLDPPYWGSIILVLAMAWLSAIVKNEAFEWPNIGSIIAHLFYAQAILEVPHINIIYWTLCLEIQFYLIFCLLIFLSQRLEKYYKNALITILVAAALISLLWPLQVMSENILAGLFLPYWHAFLLGVFAYLSWNNRLPRYFFYIYLLMIVVSSVIYQSDFSFFASLTALFVHEAANRGQITSGNYRSIQFLGVISYSLYLTHNPITGASYYTIYSIIGNSTEAQLLAFIVSTAASIIFAYLFWKLFESWSIKLSKKIFPR